MQHWQNRTACQGRIERSKIFQCWQGSGSSIPWRGFTRLGADERGSGLCQAEGGDEVVQRPCRPRGLYREIGSRRHRGRADQLSTRGD